MAKMTTSKSLTVALATCDVIAAVNATGSAFIGSLGPFSADAIRLVLTERKQGAVARMTENYVWLGGRYGVGAACHQFRGRHLRRGGPRDGLISPKYSEELAK